MPIAIPEFQAEPDAWRAFSGVAALGSERVYAATGGQYIRIRRDASKWFAATPIATLHSRS